MCHVVLFLPVFFPKFRAFWGLLDRGADGEGRAELLGGGWAVHHPGAEILAKQAPRLFEGPWQGLTST